MYFYFIVALQAFCIYHLFKYRTNFYWIFLILFLPLIGCIIYLITQVYNKRDAEKITSDITQIINPTKKVKDLEKELEFSDSYQNRINLADAYLDIKDYNNAITHYLEALEDRSQNSIYTIKKLIEAYFNIEDFENVIFYAHKIKDKSEFKKSRTQFLFGLALEQIGKLAEAEHHISQIDIRYSFYEERLTLAKFLLSIKKEEEAINLLDEISAESQHMTKTNKRIYKTTILEVDKLLTDLNTN